MRNKKSNKIMGAIDDVLGISAVRYTMPQSFNETPPTAYNNHHTTNPRTKTSVRSKKKKSKAVVMIIDTSNPKRIKIKGFKAKQKRKVEKKEKKQDMTMYGW